MSDMQNSRVEVLANKVLPQDIGISDGVWAGSYLESDGLI